MLFMNAEQAKQMQRRAQFIAVVKLLTAILAVVALWQGFVAVAFFLLFIALFA